MKQSELETFHLGPNPLHCFHAWFTMAKDNQTPMYDAFTLSTLGVEGYPQGRIVLYKGTFQEGICFYTNLTSPKALEVERTPKASATFYWPKIARQIRIIGDVQKLPRVKDEEYFATRERGSQLGAWASQQSRPLESREQLMSSLKEKEQYFSKKDVPCPDFWGGFVLIPHTYEFWINGESRLHDRFLFKKGSVNHWEVCRLNP